MAYALLVRLEKGNLNFLIDMCRWQIKKEDMETVDGATTNHHRPLIDKSSWNLLVLRLLPLCEQVLLLPPSHKPVLLGTKGGLSNLQRSEAHFSPALEEGGDPEVTGHCSQLVRKDVDASNKSKESQPSSSSKKRLKTYVPHGPQAQGRDH